MFSEKITRRNFMRSVAGSFAGAGLLALTAEGQTKKADGLYSAEKSSFAEQTLFAAGTGGYHTYRIPSLVVTKKSSLLAFCEARRNGAGDSGDIDLIFRRSSDRGRSWSEPKILWSDAENTCGNPCPVVDQKTGIIHLLLTRNLGVDKEAQIIAGTGQGTRTVWYCQSSDDGRSWSQPVEITRSVKAQNWTWFATGPGAGIQMRNGRLIVPCDHLEKETSYSHVIYSDDHGRTWKAGDRVADGNECEAVELADGRLLLNMRNYDRRFHQRAVAVSSDGGLTWSALTRDPQLSEPLCQASIRRYSANRKDKHNRNAAPGIILFSNPAGEKRVRMTVRFSKDDCATWSAGRLVYEGPSAYSCLAVAGKEIFCLYERGKTTPYEQITLAVFNAAWLFEEKPGI